MSAPHEWREILLDDFTADEETLDVRAPLDDASPGWQADIAVADYYRLTLYAAAAIAQGPSDG